jgi:hypothetical protein
LGIIANLQMAACSIPHAKCINRTRAFSSPIISIGRESMQHCDFEDYQWNVINHRGKMQDYHIRAWLIDEKY